MTEADPTVDPSLTSWLPVDPDSDFPIQNLPLGVFRRNTEPPRVGTRVGGHVVDLAVLAREGFLNGVPAATDVFAAPSLNGFLALGRPAWRSLRERLSGLLRQGAADAGAVGERAVLSATDAHILLPVEAGDYVDFYSSLEHATNLGRILRPGSPDLAPNWRYLPVGYHGRAGSLVASGTPVRRPLGQLPGPEAGSPPSFGPTRRLDFELEVGFVTGPSNERGRPIPPPRAREHVFGLVLVNDWSARDIQRWEYVPLGPFLGKSFATTVSPWVVSLDALEPFRVPGPVQDPPPLDHLRLDEPWAFDIDLEVELRPSAGPDAGAVVSRSNHRHLYWSLAQQLAHVTSNGATVRPGDLCASGTISGPEPGSFGSLMELTWGGTRPVRLPDGSERTFLEDGDAVILRGHAGGGGRPRIGFGEAAGTVIPAEVEGTAPAAHAARSAG